jgi:hypothetical protein
MRMRIIELLDAWLIRVRERHRLLGWLLTVLAMAIATVIVPVALVAGILLLLGLTGIATVVGPIALIIYVALVVALSVAGAWNKQYSPDQILKGPQGAVIVVLVVLIAALVLLVIIQSHIHWFHEQEF